MKFSRKYRLSTRAEYQNVFSRPAVARDRYFKVLSRENGRDHCRLGMAVSRRCCPGAAGRNRLKRLIRESFRRYEDQMESLHGDTLNGIDFVVLPTDQAATMCNRTLFESLDALWHKAGLKSRHREKTAETQSRKAKA